MKPRLLWVLTFVWAACVVAPAPGAGYFNMPTNLRQCLGVGYGPGYHAPMLLGPAMKAGTEAKRLRRTPAAFAPPSHGCYSHGPSAGQGGCSGPGCGGWETYLAAPQPAVLGPAAHPTPAPLFYAPGAAASGLRFE